MTQAKMTPLVRVLLTALASGIAGVSASEDALPPWARVVLAASSAALAGLGIIPPHVPTVTVVAEKAQTLRESSSPRPRRKP